MAIYSALGDALVTQEELYENAGELGDLKDAIEKGSGSPTVALTTGPVTTENVITNYTASTGERVAFEPVGIGKPLAIEIAEFSE